MPRTEDNTRAGIASHFIAVLIQGVLVLPRPIVIESDLPLGKLFNKCVRCEFFACAWFFASLHAYPAWRGWQ